MWCVLSLPLPIFDKIVNDGMNLIDDERLGRLLRLWAHITRVEELQTLIPLML